MKKKTYYVTAKNSTSFQNWKKYIKVFDMVFPFVVPNQQMKYYSIWNKF